VVLNSVVVSHVALPMRCAAVYNIKLSAPALQVMKETPDLNVVSLPDNLLRTLEVVVVAVDLCAALILVAWMQSVPRELMLLDKLDLSVPVQKDTRGMPW